MTSRLFVAMVALAALVSPASSAADQRLPIDANEWTLEYALYGGIAGLVRHLTVARDGTLTLQDMSAGSMVGRAPDELIGMIQAALQVAHEAKPPKVKREPMPDQGGLGFWVKTGGHQYALEMTSGIETLINDAVDIAERQAVVGTWRQSAWKLCKPAAQLTASDVDAPIAALIFEPNGTFSVTWRGGGAHATGIPHVAVPDYRGRYNIGSQYGSIEMHIENGLFVPSDFSGHGYFTFGTSGKELKLRKVWFGTKKAAQKPDICELTFTRQ